MNLNRLLLLILGLVFTLMPGRAEDLGETISEPGFFSYQAPKGWVAKDTSLSKYKVSFDAPKNQFMANINVVKDTFPGTLTHYVEENEKQIKAATSMFQNLVIVEEKPFTTTAGVAGVRLVVTDTMFKNDLQQTFYFFEGPADTKFTVTGTCLAADGNAYAPIFDASLQTFSPK